MNNFEPVLLKLPDSIGISLQGLSREIKEGIEEIRIQTEQPVRVISSNQEIVLSPGEIMDRITVEKILNNLMNYSVYAYEEDIAKGFITIEGGHRVGICGRTVVNNGKVTFIKDISSLNIRRAKEYPGTANEVINKILDKTYGLQNTIIVSPPKCGKTTMLRDIVRIISGRGLRVGLCDERSEIAGMYQGLPSFDIGPRTDVLDGCAKAESMLMMIRSMSPDVVVTDEIGKSEDIDAIEAALSAGVKVITTIHGSDYNDLKLSKLGPLVEEHVFSRIIFLTNIPSTGTVREVRYD